MNLLRALATVGGMTLVSRILGFVRDAVIARLFGAGLATDAFFVAFRIPNLLRRLFAEGAFSQAFVPILAEYKTRNGEVEARLLVDRVATVLTLALLAVSAIGIVAAPWIIWISAPGFSAIPEKFDLTVAMLRITFPYIVLISLTSLAGGILNTWSRFAVPAFTPTLLNLSFIFCALVLAPYFRPPVLVLAWAVLLGGVLQLAFQLPYLAKIGMLPRLRPGFSDPGVRRILKLMGPAVFGVSIAQLSLLINTVFASFLANGSVSWLYYADRLMEFPTGLLGVALGTILLPSLSKYYSSDATEQYSRLLGGIARVILRQARQQDGAQRHPQQAGGKFHQPVGVIEPGHAAVGEKRSEDGVDQQRQLGDGNAKHRRPHELEDAANTRVRKTRAQARQHADFCQIGQLERELQHAAKKHRPGQHQHRRPEIRRQHQRAKNEAQVEQRRRKCGNGKAAPGIEDAAGERHERDEQQVGKGDAQHRHRELEFLRRGGESGGADVDDPRRGEDADGADRDKDEHEHARRSVDQQPGLNLAVPGLVFGQDGHEGLGEGTLGEQAPQQVGNAEGDEKRVRREAGAEQARDHGVAHETEDAGHEGHAAHRGERAQKIHAPIIRKCACVTGTKSVSLRPFVFLTWVSSWPIQIRRASVPAKPRNSGGTTPACARRYARRSRT